MIFFNLIKKYFSFKAYPQKTSHSIPSPSQSLNGFSGPLARPPAKARVRNWESPDHTYRTARGRGPQIMPKNRFQTKFLTKSPRPWRLLRMARAKRCCTRGTMSKSWRRGLGCLWLCTLFTEENGHFWEYNKIRRSMLSTKSI